MRLLTFCYQGREMVGALSLDGERVFPLEELGHPVASMEDLIRRSTPQLLQELDAQVRSWNGGGLAYASVQKMAPIPRPRQDILCLGINYMDHAEESARFKKEAFGGERPYAVYFSKRVNRAAGDGEVLPNYAHLDPCIDYEAELGVILGRDAKDVPLEEAFQYVFGYTIINDMSARTLQTRHKQWYFGKSLDGYCPMGPWIVTRDALPEPPELEISSRVNGELRQHSNTRLMIFDIPHVIHELSQGMTLQAGTVIAMGTPAGVGMGFVPPRFLQSGDVVTCEIQGIGTLTNTLG